MSKNRGIHFGFFKVVQTLNLGLLNELEKWKIQAQERRKE